MKIVKKAYAKINLHLEVLNKREDGYHNLFLLNACPGIYDVLTFNEISISREPEKGCSIDILPGGGIYDDLIKNVETEDNLIAKAAKAFFRNSGSSGRISVSIEKNIPAGAGLGGGSSDAACTLKVLNDHLKQMSKKELIKTALEIGADVPYCLAGGFAICRETGGDIEPLQGGLDSIIVIADCGIHVNTGWAYSSLNKGTGLNTSLMEGLKKREALLKEGLKKGSADQISRILKNDFEGPVFNKYPEIKEIRDELYRHGARYAAMSGSGSSVFGLYSVTEKAEAAKKSLLKRAKVYITNFIEA